MSVCGYVGMCWYVLVCVDLCNGMCCMSVYDGVCYYVDLVIMYTKLPLL